MIPRAVVLLPVFLSCLLQARAEQEKKLGTSTSPAFTLDTLDSLGEDSSGGGVGVGHSSLFTLNTLDSLRGGVGFDTSPFFTLNTLRSATPTPTATETPTATTTPTVTTTQSPEPPCDVNDSTYDLNEDLVINAEDLLGFLVDLSSATPVVDFNCDNLTDSADLYLLSRMWGRSIEGVPESP